MRKVLLGFILFMAALLCYCDKDSESLYNKDKKYIDRPEVTNVAPAEEALAGIQEITIEGRYFSSVPGENQVYFNGQLGTVTEATENSLKVLSPNLINDSVVITIASAGALDFSEPVSYRLKGAVYDYIALGEEDDPEMLACDKDENLYMLDSKVVYKITPQGERTEYGSVKFFITTDCKIGPEGYLYFARKNAKIYRIAPGGGEAEEWVKAPEKVYAFDFDEQGNMIVGGKDEVVHSISPAGEAVEIGKSVGYEVISMKLFDGSLYVLATDSETERQVVLKGAYSNGSLGDLSVYIDWQNIMPEETAINSFVVSENGEVYIASNHEKGILVFTSGTEWEPLYDGLIFPDVLNMTWGNGLFAYYVSEQEDGYHLIITNLLKNGAPYFGRK